MKPAPFPLSRPDIQSVRVLLVDDSTHVRNELRQLLELSGTVEVVGEAANGLEAVRLASKVALDVVVMDLEMPVMDGMEATHRIKTISPSTRVVILSVHSGVETEERIKAAGADQFVIKGAEFQTLLNAILGKEGKINSMKKEKSHE